jgi:hypothetical protein
VEEKEDLSSVIDMNNRLSARKEQMDLPPGHPMLQAMEDAKRRWLMENATSKKPDVKIAKKTRVHKVGKSQEDSNKRIAAEETIDRLNKASDRIDNELNEYMKQLKIARDEIGGEYVMDARLMRIERLLVAFKRGLVNARIMKRHL